MVHAAVRVLLLGGHGLRSGKRHRGPSVTVNPDRNAGNSCNRPNLLRKEIRDMTPPETALGPMTFHVSNSALDNGGVLPHYRRVVGRTRRRSGENNARRSYSRTLSRPSALFLGLPNQFDSFELSCRLFVGLSGRQGSGVKLLAPEQNGTCRRWPAKMLLRCRKAVASGTVFRELNESKRSTVWLNTPCVEVREESPVWESNESFL